MGNYFACFDDSEAGMQKKKKKSFAWKGSLTLLVQEQNSNTELGKG